MERSLIEKYFLEGLDEAETRQLVSWLEGDECNQRYFARLKNIWVFSGLSGIRPTNEAQKEADRLLARLNASEESPGKTVFTSFSKNVVLRVAGIAAAIIVLIGFPILMVHFFAATKKASFYTVETRAAEKSIVHLADGTTIWLNAETSIRIPENIHQKHVDMYIEGEAFFDIPHLKGRQVVVHASDIHIKVVGTAFNVKSYPGEKQIETTLIRGKVVIEKSMGDKLQNIAEINPNQRFIYNRITQKGVIPAREISSGAKIMQEKMVEVSRKDVAVNKNSMSEELEKYIAWKDGRFVFRSEPFETLSNNMERWYGVKIINKFIELNGVKFNGSFEKENIEQAMRALSSSFPFSYTIKHDTVVIIPR